MKFLKTFAQLATSLHFNYNELLDILSSPDMPEAFIYINMDDNPSLKQPGLLHLNKAIFQQIAILVTCELNGCFNELNLELLHPRGTKVDGQHVVFLTFDEYKESINTAKIEYEKKELAIITVNEKFLLKIMRPEMPSGYVEGGHYFQISKVVRKRPLKVYEEPGYSKSWANVSSFYTRPKPDWTKIGKSVFTSTTKILTPNNILVRDHSEEIILKKIKNDSKSNKNKLILLPPCLDPDNKERYNSGIDAVIKLEEHLYDKGLMHTISSKKQQAELEKIFPEFSGKSHSNARVRITTVARGGKVESGAKKNNNNESL